MFLDHPQLCEKPENNCRDNWPEFSSQWWDNRSEMVNECDCCCDSLLMQKLILLFTAHSQFLVVIE
jgi:hypothetical protein